MKADPKVIADLQTSCQLMAHLAEQYRVDAKQLKGMGLDWLAKRVKKWYGGAEEFLEQFIERLIYFETDAEYSAGNVVGADTVTAILERDQKLADDAHDALCGFRKAAWDSLADGTTDIYEHAIQELEEQCFKMTRELKLIKQLTEAGYIGARLEDS